MSKNNNHKNAFYLLLTYLWSKDFDIRLRIVTSLICLVIAKVINIFVPIVYKYIIDGLNQNLSLSVLIGVIIGYGGTKILAQIFSELRNIIFSKVGCQATRLVALNVFKHMHNLSMRFHITRKTGGLSRSIERGTKGIEAVLRYSLFNIFPTSLEIILVIGILWYFHGIWFAVTLLITMIVYVCYTLLISTWRISFAREMNQSDNTANNRAIDSLLNFETVKYFNNEEYEAIKFNDALQAYEKSATKITNSLSILNIGQDVIISLGLVSLMILSVNAINQNKMMVGDLIMVNAYLFQLSIPLSILGFAYREIKNALVNMEDMFKLLDIPAEIQDSVDAKELIISKCKVSFNNVSFAYNKERTILHNITFTIESGKTIAVVGSSGAGKSTISRLLFRFYDINSGSIIIDNQDIREVKQGSLRKSIGIVPQDTVLFNDTIYYNIAYGNNAASYDEVIAASKNAHIHEFISVLPEGYATQVGERGLKLSGGEKQRIAIARTILKNPSIYVFDEATSSLDTKTEKLIQASLKEISANHTTLIIAHRLSTIVDADEIIVLDNGYIVERGNHKTLLKNQGYYAELWYKQQEECNQDTQNCKQIICDA
ncbi:ABCB family ABC transporter ATP-binding protein/permease [Rickettsia prowazekii]|nr:ABC transporter ATP-binding protein/permease [Rickettsia prowazekii]AFE49027.1 multidrug resistance transporter ATM1 [Rickettsia prowazekii str. Chernikova]AFE49873.1 multidrug resistance transporter ATM1 [Rickettsia prowazekii str. Katsinyian]AFE50717.1 multidrug resistance transporter ATM1 [Rickettsia prowazekii str. BuV67-CWPP]AFE51557.1 multidrug resistance transporter ATM1 [Rickettsia prowazekii str. Dachau]AGJ02170.1 DNA gyrase subunit A [Rickettsia prowazekii str. NMRC Madrid E]